MKILSIESSAFPASCAIWESGKIIAEYYINTGFTHSETLMPMIESVLQTAKVNINDINLIAVSNGPGSFTGVRIGIASAKGLAVPFETPCLAVSSLEGLAYNLHDDYSNRIIYSVIDARVGQCYNGVFELACGKIERNTEDRVITLEEITKEIESLSREKEIWLVGDYAEKLYDNLENKVNVYLAPVFLRNMRAAGIAMCAEIKAENDTQTAAEIQPMYLQLPQATRELRKRLNNK